MGGLRRRGETVLIFKKKKVTIKRKYNIKKVQISGKKHPSVLNTLRGSVQTLLNGLELIFASQIHGSPIRTETPKHTAQLILRVFHKWLGVGTFVGNLLSSCCGAPSLTRGWVCNLRVQFAVSMVQVPQNS
jgi:hypothetical protein